MLTLGMWLSGRCLCSWYRALSSIHGNTHTCAHTHVCTPLHPHTPTCAHTPTRNTPTPTPTHWTHTCACTPHMHTHTCAHAPTPQCTHAQYSVLSGPKGVAELERACTVHRSVDMQGAHAGLPAGRGTCYRSCWNCPSEGPRMGSLKSRHSFSQSWRL
jgi:hypothetical protein